MELRFSGDALDRIETDVLLVGVTENGSLPAPLAARLGDGINPVLEDFSGKSGDEIALYYPAGAIPARRLLLVGLGAEEKVDAERLRRATARGLSRAAKLKATSVATTLAAHPAPDLSPAEVAAAVAEGALLAAYRYSLKSEPDDEGYGDVEALTLLDLDDGAERGARLGEAIARGVAEARDLVNGPPNISNAPHFADLARRIAAESPHIKTTIFSLDEAREMGMGAFAGVGQGSAAPPQFIILEYRVDELEAAPFGIVGKGLIFDTGGINLKKSADLWKMKTDMSGGAAVLGTFRALAALPEPLDLPVVGIVPATDNAIDAASFTPADVLTALNGKTIEIQNTDAEGRLILADALTYIDRYHPRAVVDLATLTGSVVVALGPNVTGMFSNDDALAERLLAAGETSGETLWRLPLVNDYNRMIRSSIADVKNTGKGGGGAISAALFLQNFIGDYPWAHLDIAGTAWGESRQPKVPYNNSGASGVGVRLLMATLMAEGEEG